MIPECIQHVVAAIEKGPAPVIGVLDCGTLYYVNWEHPAVKLKRELGETRFEAARARYEVARKEAENRGSMSDSLCGFEFVIGMYSPIVWKRFFDEDEAAA